MQCCNMLTHYYCNTASASFGTSLQTWDGLHVQHDDTSAPLFMTMAVLTQEERTGVALFVAGFVVIRLHHFLS